MEHPCHFDVAHALVRAASALVPTPGVLYASRRRDECPMPPYLAEFVGQAPGLRGALSPASLFESRPGSPPQANGPSHNQAQKKHNDSKMLYLDCTHRVRAPHPSWRPI